MCRVTSLRPRLNAERVYGGKAALRERSLGLRLESLYMYMYKRMWCKTVPYFEEHKLETENDCIIHVHVIKAV